MTQNPPPSPLAQRWSDLSRPPLDPRALRRALEGPEGGAWRAVELVAETGSTNADVAARARAGEAEGLVLLAEHQTAGRGRLTREWIAPPRSSVMVSVLLRPGVSGPGSDEGAVPAERWSWLPLLAALAVTDALTTVCGLPARLKWPNDVLVPDGGDVRAAEADVARFRKVCGVLAEAVVDAADPQSGAVVLGAGINVTQQRDELPPVPATSLTEAGSATTDRDTVARAYLRALSTRYRAWRAAGGDPRGSGIAAAYRERCVTIGRPVAVQLPGGESVTGDAEGVDDDGRLLVAGPGGVRALAAGDVVHVRPREVG